MNLYFDWDFETAARNLERAIALNPSYAPAITGWAFFKQSLRIFQPRSARCSRHGCWIQRPCRSGPISAFISITAGKTSRLKRHCKAYLRGIPISRSLTSGWGGFLHASDDCERASSHLDQAFSRLGDWQPYIAAHGHVAGSCGNPAAAIEDLNRFETLGQTRFVTSYGRALIHAGLNDTEQVLNWLRKAVEERSHWMVWSRLDPRWDKFRAEPRFQQLVREVFPDG